MTCSTIRSLAWLLVLAVFVAPAVQASDDSLIDGEVKMPVTAPAAPSVQAAPETHTPARAAHAKASKASRKKKKGPAHKARHGKGKSNNAKR